MKQTKDITITYDTLFELLKRERDMADLQKLDTTFYTDFANYLREKQGMLQKEDSIFSYDERKKTEKQIENARRIIKELYDRREKKVINFALTKSRTKINIMDMSAFLEQEHTLFDELSVILEAYRDSIANNLIVGRDPTPPGTFQRDETTGEMPFHASEPRADTKLVRFLYAVPKFVGTELEEYGPFNEEDIANLPSPIADLLMEKGKVEEIKG